MARQKSLSTTVLPPNDLASRTLILDNGAHTIKAGFSSHLSSTPVSTTSCHVIPNCIARSTRDRRTYIGPELTTCADFGDLAYRRPVEKGYVVNWEGEKAIWERTFLANAAKNDGSVLGCDPAETNLILSEAPNAPVSLQRNADEMVFEEFGFGAYYRTIAPALNAYAPSPFPSTSTSPAGIPLECMLLVDAGHSHTTVTPLYHGRPLHPAIRRLEIGGKTLTNRLKELISRTFDVHREDHLVEEIKEDVCYVSPTFTRDLERTWKGGRYDGREVDSSVVVDYVLPDYEHIKRGFYRPHDTDVMNLRNRALGIGTETGRREHVVTLGNERFTVPELLFTPSDIGMRQAGLCGTVLQSLDALPEGLRQAYLANIVVVGGTSLLPGFVARLEGELRASVDEGTVIRVARAESPVKNVWMGGVRLATDEAALRAVVVTRQEWAENGEGWVRRRFAGKKGPGIEMSTPKKLLATVATCAIPIHSIKAGAAMGARKAVESTRMPSMLSSPTSYPIRYRTDPATAAIVTPAQTPDRTLGASSDPLTTAS
ncbi:Actin- protein 6 [Friedmanniomyces endolithicus]|uniref:Actin-like protein ARP6 n=1 Tax=Friedmanniomyces endolithicus TaxID=329885 RepID=A0AAN6G213_9PEZI|nr:Actin- protein 6 [Friedmanniomyces endolithicus]KAK0295663.1 Actin- protein 6 [Friedmanniomyces endolithicus]KAK0326380.1 Actin- protein 6 [Friedmanniomyces endolithicus]KAK0993314.1 Actin-related protein 6 [Friedmanniomyces endolithicus]